MLNIAPYLLRGLTIAGNTTIFCVDGSMMSYGITAQHHLKNYLTTLAIEINSLLATIKPILADALIGIIAGGITVLLFQVAKKWFPQKAVGH